MEAKQAKICAKRIQMTLAKNKIRLLDFDANDDKSLKEVVGFQKRALEEDNVKQPSAGVDAEEADASVESSYRIPKSMNEIYQLTHQNKRLKNEQHLNLKHDSTKAIRKGKDDGLDNEEKEVVDKQLEEYFERKTSKVPTEGETVTKENIELMKEVGWIDSKNGAKDMDVKAARISKIKSKNESRSNTKKSSSSTITSSTFDYSKVSPSMGAMGGIIASSNPFFTGGDKTNGNTRSKTTEKANINTKLKKGSNIKRGTSTKRNVEKPQRRDTNTFVYRKSGAR